MADDQAVDKYKLKEQSEHPCRCGSFKYTQTISEKVGVLCKECLGKSLDNALNDTLEKLGVEHRV